MLTWVVAAALACDQAGLGRLVDAIGHVSPAYYEEIAAAGFSEACTGPVAASAARWSQVPPEARRLADAQALLDAPELWTAACPAGVGVPAQAIQLAPADARAWVYGQCDLGRLGWFTREVWLGGEASWLPLLAGAHLRAERVPEDRIGVIVRAWLGVGPQGAAPPPEPELLPFLSALDEMTELPPEEERLFGAESADGLGAWSADLGAADGAPRDDGKSGVLGSLDGLSSAPEPSWEEMPRIVDLATPQWPPGARMANATCWAVVTVSETGAVLATDTHDCPRALRRPVLAAVSASTFAPAVVGGVAVSGVIELSFRKP